MPTPATKGDTPPPKRMAAAQRMPLVLDAAFAEFAEAGARLRPNG